MYVYTEIIYTNIYRDRYIRTNMKHIIHMYTYMNS